LRTIFNRGEYFSEEAMKLLAPFYDIDRIMSEQSENEKLSSEPMTPIEQRIPEKNQQSPLDDVVGKLENLLMKTQNASHYQIEKDLLARKVEEYVKDLKILEGNVQDCEKIIKKLCCKIKVLKSENLKLKHENADLAKLHDANALLKHSLSLERVKTTKLCQKLENIRESMIEYFEGESTENNEYVQRIEKLSTENHNLRHLFSEIHSFSKDSKIDEILTSSEFSKLNTVYGIFHC